MKLKGNRLLALVSMAILNIFAMFALTNSAHAQTLVQTVTQGGVTCKQYTAQTTYPDKYWNCDSTVTPVDARVITTASNGLQAPVKGVLQSGAPNLQLYVFKKAADFAAFFSVTSPPANAMGTIKGNDTAVVFSEAVQDGQTVNLKSYFKPHMHQQLGRLYNSVDSNHPAYGLRFSAAVQYDRDEMDRFTATTPFGALPLPGTTQREPSHRTSSTPFMVEQTRTSSLMCSIRTPMGRQARSPHWKALSRIT